MIIPLVLFGLAAVGGLILATQRFKGAIQGRTNGVFAAEAGYGLGRRAGEGEDDEGRRRTGRSAHRC